MNKWNFRCSHHFSSCFVKTQVYNTVLVFISLHWEYTLAACWDNSFLKCLFHCQSSRKKDCHIPADFHTGYNIKIYQKCERKDLFFVNTTSKHFWSLRVTSLEWQQKIWLPPMTGLEWVNGGTPSDRSLRLTQSDDITRQYTLTELNVSINSHSWSSVIARVCRTDILIVGGLSQCTF